MNAADVMTTRIITVLPETSAREVARMLHANRVSAVPVVDTSGRVIGMLSDGDLVRRAKAAPDGGGPWWSPSPTSGPSSACTPATQDMTARDVMTREVFRITEDTSLEDVATLLARHGIKRVPVERDGKLIGLVSRANLVQGLAARRPRGAASSSDVSIRTAILSVLEQAAISTHLMNVVVADGTAYLWGAVESASENDAIVAAAAATPGVKRVSDHLFVLTSRLRPGMSND